MRHAPDLILLSNNSDQTEPNDIKELMLEGEVKNLPWQDAWLQDIDRWMAWAKYKNPEGNYIVYYGSVFDLNDSDDQIKLTKMGYYDASGYDCRDSFRARDKPDFYDTQIETNRG